MQDREPEDFDKTTALRDIWQLFSQDKIALTSFLSLFIANLTALFSRFIAPYHSDQQFIGLELLPPLGTRWADCLLLRH